MAVTDNEVLDTTKFDRTLQRTLLRSTGLSSTDTLQMAITYLTRTYKTLQRTRRQHASTYAAKWCFTLQMTRRCSTKLDRTELESSLLYKLRNRTRRYLNPNEATLQWTLLEDVLREDAQPDRTNCCSLRGSTVRERYCTNGYSLLSPT